MTDNVENLTLEHLKRLQGSLDRIERTLNDHTARLGNLDSGQSVIVQHLAHFSAADAVQQVAIDHINGRLDRIERRLDLAN